MSLIGSGLITTLGGKKFWRKPTEQKVMLCSCPFLGKVIKDFGKFTQIYSPYLI
jgi:hypothetical protein